MTQIWAHRGASSSTPENTMQAFERAFDLGADGIELDVHLTKDGEVVVCHDETVDRTSDGKGRIAGYTLWELKQMNFATGAFAVRPEGIPELRDVLALCARRERWVNIELKTDAVQYPEIEQKCVELVRECGMEARVWYSSFNHYTLQTLRAVNPDARMGILYMEGLYEPWVYAKHAGAQALHLYYPTLITPELMPSCRREGVRVHPWTVDDEGVLRNCFLMGVDAVITDDPALALRLRVEVQGK